MVLAAVLAAGVAAGAGCQASELLEVSDDGASLRRIVEFDESLVVRKGRQGGGGGGGGGGNRDATIFIGNLDRWAACTKVLHPGRRGCT